MDFDVTRAIPVNNANERQPQFDVSRAVPVTDVAQEAAPEGKGITMGEVGQIALKNLKAAPMGMLEEVGKVAQVIRWPFWRFIEHPVSTVVSALQEPQGKTAGGTVARAAQAFVPFRQIPKEEYGSYAKVWDTYYQSIMKADNQGFKEETPGWYLAMASYGSAMAVEPPAIEAAAKGTELALTRVATAEEASAIKAHFDPLKANLERRGVDPAKLHPEGNIIKINETDEIYMNKYVSAVLRGDEIRIPRWAKVEKPSNLAVVEPKGGNIVPTEPEILPTTGPEVVLKSVAPAVSEAAASSQELAMAENRPVEAVSQGAEITPAEIQTVADSITPDQVAPRKTGITLLEEKIAAETDKKVKADLISQQIQGMNLILKENKGNAEMADYLSNVKSQRDRLMSELDKPGMVSMRELTYLKKQLEVARQGFKAGASDTRKEIQGLQEAVINMIDEAGIPSEYKGRFMRAVKNIQTPAEFEKEVVDLSNRISTLADRLKREGIAGKIESLSSKPMDVKYKAMIEEKTKGYDLSMRSEKVLKERQGTRDFVKRMESEGAPHNVPADILSEANKISLGEANIEDLQRLLSDVEHLARLGKTSQAVRQANYESEKMKIKEKLLPKIHSINSRKMPDVPIGTDHNTWAERYIGLLNHFSKTKVGLTPMEGLADITGMGDVKKVIDADFGEYLTFNDQYFREWHDLTKDFEQGNFDRIGAYAIMQQEGGAERLANTGKIDQAKSIELTPEEARAYEYVRKVFDDHYPLVAQFTREVYNEEVGQVKNYVSFLSDTDAMSDLEIYDRFGQRPQEAIAMRKKNVERGFTKERAAVSNIKLELNIDKIFRRHMDDVAYMLTMGRDIKMYSEIINSPETKEALGDIGALAWLQWTDLLARKGGAEAGQKIALIDLARRNMGAGVLGFRLSSTLVQLSSFGDAMATIGSRWASSGVKNIATSQEWRNFVMDNFPEVAKAVGDDIAFREFGEDFFGKMARAGMKPLQWMDSLMRSSATAGAYERVMTEMGLEVDLTKPNKEAIAEATRLMRQSQGSSFYKDQPLSITTGYGFMENRAINKLFLQFQSFMLGRWDNINRQVYRLGIKEKDFGKAFMSIFWLMTFGFTGEEVLRRTTRQITQAGVKSKRKEKPFAQDVAMNMLQAVPLMGSMASSVVYSGNPVPMIQTWNSFWEGVSGAITAKSKEAKTKNAVKAVGAAGSVLGISGAAQAAQLINERIPSRRQNKIRE